MPRRVGGSLQFPSVLDRLPGALPAVMFTALLVASPAAAAAGQPSGRSSEPSGSRAPLPVVLLTMGPDHSVLFREWGHAALCVGDRCLNYGTTDFSRPLGLVWEVLRGRALFWVSVSPYDAVLDTYFRDDRSVFRQDLELSPEGRDLLLGRITADLVPGAGGYIYDHFRDNCTTRIRDYLDEAAAGALGEPLPLPPRFSGRGSFGRDREATFRTHIRRGLGDRPLLLWLSDIGVGQAVDRPISSFEAMFLPGALRHGVEAVYGAPPRQLHRGRDGDLLPADPGSGPYLPWLFAVAFGLALLILIPGPGVIPRAAAGTTVALLTLVGAAACGVLALTPLPEFRTSLLAFGVPPTDFLLATRHRRWYGPLRLAGGVLFLVLLLAGVIRQPLGWTVLAALLPVGAIAFRRRGRKAIASA